MRILTSMSSWKQSSFFCRCRCCLKARTKASIEPARKMHSLSLQVLFSSRNDMIEFVTPKQVAKWLPRPKLIHCAQRVVDNYPSASGSRVVPKKPSCNYVHPARCAHRLSARITLHVTLITPTISPGRPMYQSANTVMVFLTKMFWRSRRLSPVGTKCRHLLSLLPLFLLCV